MPAQYADRLKASEWTVRDLPLIEGRALVRKHHYARGGANTRTYMHGLFPIDNSPFKLQYEEPQGVTWWIPPTRSAAIATYPQNPEGVLALSRLVVTPETPKNACSFMLARSMKLIDRKKWPCLVTYADQWQGHQGTIYKATNWKFVGMTDPEATFTLNGRMISRKAGNKTRTMAQMKTIGAVFIGRFAKFKYVHIA